ncbi:inositol polyphosphate multikinase isoform X1 [Malaclemys terrapin pileata]|uniref:inositol polyphosphate multikinase isoform X1 n=1 Tax=Malaclemys terrapin pileata TaxID=2991368 RepID=UPI0023A7C9DE|nr:inositol polyphosphate multikinase isoform X1 [Malaclemys terrapin pileata]
MPLLEKGCNRLRFVRRVQRVGPLQPRDRQREAITGASRRSLPRSLHAGGRASPARRRWRRRSRAGAGKYRGAAAASRSPSAEGGSRAPERCAGRWGRGPAPLLPRQPAAGEARRAQTRSPGHGNRAPAPSAASACGASGQRAAPRWGRGGGRAAAGLRARTVQPLSRGILQHPDGTVLKQLQPPPRGPREQEFYNKVYAADCCDSVLLELRKYLPKYFGSWSPPTAPNDLYLKLEDVTRKFNKPCIMDVKIGQKSYDPYASAEKIQQQVSKYPLMEEIGFLVLGMRVYHIHSDSYETQNQHYGRSLTKETIKDGMSRFFHNGYCLRKDAVAASIQKIEKILQWFESQEQLNFYASSLLFVYEGSCQLTATRLSDGTLAEKRVVPKGLLQDGDLLEYNNNIHVINSTENGKREASVGKSLPKIYAFHKKAYSKRHHSQISLKTENLEQDNVWKSSTCISQEHLNGNVIPQLEKVFCHMPKEMKENADVEVKMIDFAHVFPSNTKDKGYIYGLKNLITVLQNILDN